MHAWTQGIPAVGKAQVIHDDVRRDKISFLTRCGFATFGNTCKSFAKLLVMPAGTSRPQQLAHDGVFDHGVGRVPETCNGDYRAMITSVAWVFKHTVNSICHTIPIPSGSVYQAYVHRCGGVGIHCDSMTTPIDTILQQHDRIRWTWWRSMWYAQVCPLLHPLCFPITYVEYKMRYGTQDTRAGAIFVMWLMISIQVCVHNKLQVCAQNKPSKHNALSWSDWVSEYSSSKSSSYFSVSTRNLPPWLTASSAPMQWDT